MLRKANNVFSVLLNDAATTATGLPGANTAGTLVTDANLAAGAIVVTDLGNRLITAASYALLNNGDQFLVVQGKGVGKPLMKSPVLTKGKIKLTAARFKAAVQQVTTIGYNGTTGSLPVANNTSFFVKIKKRDNDAANRSQPMSLFAGPVKTDATGTQAELATLLAASGARNFKAEPANGYLKFEMICDNAGAASTAASGTITFTNGSRVITTSGATPATDYVVGSYIRIGTAVTSAVYKVAAVSNALQTITLTSAFVGTSGTLTVTNHQFITAVLANAANFGLVITGIAAPFDVNAFRDYYANRFTATFSDSSTLVTLTTGARNGNGVWQQVAMDEYMNYGFEGQNNQLATPSVPRDQVVKIPGVGTATALTSKYCALNIAWEESIGTLVTMAGGKGNVVVYANLTNNAGLGRISLPVDTTGYNFIATLGGPTAFGVAAYTDLDE
jgi:hypothetical protein